MNTVYKAPVNTEHLSDFMNFLPSDCILNKGITGCGGTTLEMNDKRNSVILVPTKNLVLSKMRDNILSVMEGIEIEDIITYNKTHKGYKKIMGTYNALPKILKAINPKEYFLLIDEYHLLYNDYGFRSDAIIPILQHYKDFNNFCFMTATPLSEEAILQELKDIPTYTIEWPQAVNVNLEIHDTSFVLKELEYTIQKEPNVNWHIFINSIYSINAIVKYLKTEDYRIVCSSTKKRKIKNYADITSTVKKLNFYTSCAFEGTDIYDKYGKTIIVSDTSVSSTILDISTKVRQICGRLRDSIYKNQCIFILNTKCHRYAGKSKTTFNNQVLDNERRGQELQQEINNYSEDRMQTAVKLYSQDTYSGLYINKYNNKIFYDQNLKSMDIYNYKLISEIYDHKITVLMECAQINNISPQLEEPNKGAWFVYDILTQQLKDTFTLDELEDIFKPVFKKQDIKWSKGFTINKYFPKFDKYKKIIKGQKYTMYKFYL